MKWCFGPENKMFWGVLTIMCESIWRQSAAVFSFGPSHSSRIWNWGEYLVRQPERWNSGRVTKGSFRCFHQLRWVALPQLHLTKKSSRVCWQLDSTHCECGGWFVAGWWHDGRQTFKKIQNKYNEGVPLQWLPVFYVWQAARRAQKRPPLTGTAQI